MIRTQQPLALLGLALSVALPAQAPAVPEDVVEHLRREIDQGTRMGVVVGLVNADGVAFFAYGRGEASADARQLDERSVFEIGSISKTFTGILLADMAVRGEVSLDDRVQDFLPDGVEISDYDGQHITLAHLSTHRSSLPRLPGTFIPRDGENPYADYTVEQLYSFLDRHDLRRPIGSEFEYSNLAVGLLGHLLARHAGTDYETLLVQRIAEPLEMGDTRIALSGGLQERLAKGHSGTKQVKNWDLPTLAGAGAIRSTAQNMLRYLAANMGLVDSRLDDAMQLAQTRRAVTQGASGIGLGWMLRPTEDLLVTWHNGGTGGYKSFAGFNDRGLGAVVLSNCDASVDVVGVHLLDPSFALR